MQGISYANGGTAPGEAAANTADTVWVRVWFDPEGRPNPPTLIENYRASPVAAERYKAALAKRYHGLTVTIDALPDPAPQRDLPCEQLWLIAP